MSSGKLSSGRSSYRVRERPRLSLPSEEGNLLTRGSTGSRRTWRACRGRRQRPRRVQLPPPMPSSGRVKRATSSLIRDPRGLLPAGSLDPSRSLVEGPRLARGPRTGAAERAPLTVASLGPDRRVTTVTASSRTPTGSNYLLFTYTSTGWDQSGLRASHRAVSSGLVGRSRDASAAGASLE